MGVCGVGKSSVAKAIAEARAAPFVEADDLHPRENVAAMRAGRPLDDAMRWGWLDAVGSAVVAAGPGAVLACSALSRAHRDRLRGVLEGRAADPAGALRIVFLHGDRKLIAARMAARQGHFMPASLIDSQLAILQPPDPQGESAIWIDIAQTPEAVLRAALHALR